MIDFSSINSFWGSYNMAAMNDARLMQAMSKNPGASSSLGSTGGTGSTGSLSGTSKSFLKEYQNSMTDLMEAASAVKNSGKTVGANSSNSDVATADLKFSSGVSGQYDIEVYSVASKQKNQSSAYNAGAGNALRGDLTITGNNGKEVTIDVGSYTTAKTNRQALERAAKDINKQNIGVTASVVEKDGKVSLALESSETGEKNSFLVGGSFGASSGLSTPVEKARDAEYAITDKNGRKEYTSSSNTINVDSYKLQATLKGTGKTSITLGEDVSKTADAVENMISAYNDTLSFLDKYAGMGDGMTKQLKNMLSKSVSEKSLNTVGISVAKDGTMKLDRKKFTEKMNENPKLVNDIIRGNSGLASDIFTDAKTGMSVPASNLLNTNNSGITGGGLGDVMGFGGSGYSSATYRNVLNYSSTLSLLNSLI